jgi:hypothetical protein
MEHCGKKEEAGDLLSIDSYETKVVLEGGNKYRGIACKKFRFADLKRTE